VGSGMTGSGKGAYFQPTELADFSFSNWNSTWRIGANGNEDTVHRESLYHVAQSTGMFRFHVSQEDRIDAPDCGRPNRIQRGDICARIEKNCSGAAALPHQVGVGDPNSVLHLQWPNAKWQCANFRLGVPAGPQRTQADFVQAQHSSHPPQFIAREIGSVIERIAQPAQRDVCASGHGVRRQSTTAHRFFEHVADFIFQRQGRIVYHANAIVNAGGTKMQK
jgi:hypothetical protein